MSTGSLDGNGVWQYGEDDDGSTFSGLLALLTGPLSTRLALPPATIPAATGYTAGTGADAPVALFRNGVVHLRGQFNKNSGNVASSDAFCTIPTSLCPTRNETQSAFGVAGFSAGVIFGSSGVISVRTIAAGSSTSIRLDGINYVIV